MGRWILMAMLIGAVPAPALAKAKGKGKGQDPPRVKVEAKSGEADIGTSNTFGVGIKLGDPFVLTGKLWFNEMVALDLQLGGSFVRMGPVVGADLLFHLRDLLGKALSFEMAVQIGVGGGFGLWSRGDHYHKHDDPWEHWHRHDVQEPLAWIRATGGVALMFRAVPVEVFMEFGFPTLVFSTEPLARWLFTGGVGARYYF